MEGSLLGEFDALVDERGGTRSEVLRDLARKEVVRSRVEGGAWAVATLTLVYDHHVRDLAEKLTDIQHELGDQVRSTLHVHLSHDYCLEVIVMQGCSRDLRALADRLIATRGVKHGGIEIISGVAERPMHTHAHAHPHAHAHSHASKIIKAPAKSAAKAKPPKRSRSHA